MVFKEEVINKLVSLCESAYADGEIPVAAAIVDKDCNIISFSSNKRQNDFCVLNHAEISAIVDAEKSLGDWRLNGYCLISTLEPCDMCSAVIKESRLDKVFYFLDRSSPYIYGNDLIVKSKILDFPLVNDKLFNLLTSFFKDKR